MAESVHERVTSQPSPKVETLVEVVRCSNGVVCRDSGGGCGEVEKTHLEKSLAHHKNDSGSYDVPPNCLSANSASAEFPVRHEATVSIHVSNGLDSSNHTHHPHTHHPHTHHPRVISTASIHSEGCGPSSSSSSSVSCDLSRASSFNSRELLEQLISDLNFHGEAIENNEVVKQLLEHIITLKLELEELKQENSQLKEVRTTMDDEMHTLTENLFEEAYKMVDTVKEEKGQAFKRLADAAGKIDAMETEMSALKNLLRVPSPNSSATTKLGSPHARHKKPNVKKALKKLSRKVKLSMSNAEPVTAHHTLLEHTSQVKGACLSDGQMDPNEFLVFHEWLSDVSREGHPYLLGVLEEDVKPCLNFKNKQLSSQVLTAVKNNDLLMESLSPCTSEEKRVCVLSTCEEISCTHRMRLVPSQQWLYISQHCRDRIVAVCDFYMYMSHIEKGILKQSDSHLYWQVARLRAQMNLARLTLLLPE